MDRVLDEWFKLRARRLTLEIHSMCVATSFRGIKLRALGEEKRGTTKDRVEKKGPLTSDFLGLRPIAGRSGSDRNYVLSGLQGDARHGSL